MKYMHNGVAANIKDYITTIIAYTVHTIAITKYYSVGRVLKKDLLC